jgi:cell fate regulator YaaT (PSP1 superfamily)
MKTERVVLVRVQNLERETVYFGVDTPAGGVGQTCVVDHSGLRLGVILATLDAGAELGEHLGHMIRMASPDDIQAYQYNQADAERVLSSTREAVALHGLPMHLVAAEYTLDRKQLRVYFTAPRRVDFRGLLRDLAARYSARIELRQMGARDEARIKGGLGRCGMEICCHRFLRDTHPIPMEMAYDQELFVAPDRITGACGRLMCCLAYEHDAYRKELAGVPKLGAQIQWQDKTGKLISHNIFRRTVTLLTNDRERLEVDVSEITVLRPGKRQRR